MLLRRFVELLEEGWRHVFPQRRTLERAIEHALAITTVAGRRTISRAILALGRAQVDWTADYRLFSERQWNPAALFAPVERAYLERYDHPNALIGLALDDTVVARAGLHVPHTRWRRDPMSPPFHTNLIHGLRFVQVALVFPHHREGDYGARALPVRFTESVSVPKPQHNATESQWAQYRALRKTKNLVLDACALMEEVRVDFDHLGAHARTLVFTVDGSYANRTVFRNIPERTEILARFRKDAKLCFPAAPGSRRFYGTAKFTPEEILRTEHWAFEVARVSIGGTPREIKYKEVKDVLWQGGARRRRLRLMVLAPIPYRLSPHSRLQYRQPAYLITSDLTRAASELIQLYVDRWQIEVNHRDEKEILGIGDAQVWAEKSVGRHPAFRVAAYSLLLLAALLELGITRTEDYLALPAWRTRAPKRASTLDMLTRLRLDIHQSPAFDRSVDQIAQNLAHVAYG